MEHTLIQGPRGGFYWLDENGAKHYVSGKAKKAAKAAKSGKTNSKNVKPVIKPVTPKPSPVTPKPVTPKPSPVKKCYTGWFDVYDEDGEQIDDFKEWTIAESWEEALRNFRHDYPDTQRYQITLHTVEDVKD